MERVNWIYAFVGLCFGGLAVLRADQGSVVWTVVFGLAALSNVYLSVRFVIPPRFGGEARPEVGRSGSSATISELSSEGMRRSLRFYESAMRRWLVIAVIGWTSTVGLLLLVPLSGLLVAVLALFATHRHLRCRRSVAILRRALAITTDEARAGAGGEATR